jgi:hypothetical protein
VGTQWVMRSNMVHHPLLVTESKIVTPLAKIVT